MELDSLYPLDLEPDSSIQQFMILEPLSPLNFDDSPVKIPIGPKPALCTDSNKFKKMQAFNAFLLEKVGEWHKL